ncbi:MAG: pyridoxal-phosphate dependent enzyme [Acidobacteriota bacterium]|nr:pyridoxal-phosphate dependent enzyme [Acidobacteriota bacterium]
MRDAAALERLKAFAAHAIPVATQPTPVEELTRLRAALGGGPRLMIKRDDALPFAMGGNKVRKLRLLVRRALDDGADTLITMGGLQSNHARVTAAMAAATGLRSILVLNGEAQAVPTGNARLQQMFGAEIVYVDTREAREPAMHEAAAALTRRGGRPFIVPLGGSTPEGALGYAHAFAELMDQIDPPDVIVHSTSSGGTQAGLAAGAALFGVPTRIIGVSADDPAGAIMDVVRGLVPQIGARLGADALSHDAVEADDTFVGGGYGVPTPSSTEALTLAARSEGLLLDPVYTAKAMAGLVARVRAGGFRSTDTVLFWHTGGTPALFT